MKRDCLVTCTIGETLLVNSPRDNDTYADLVGWTVGDYIDYLEHPPHARELKNLYHS